MKDFYEHQEWKKTETLSREFEQTVRSYLGYSAAKLSGTASNVKQASAVETHKQAMQIEDLMRAAGIGDVTKVKALLDTGLDPDATVSVDGWSPIVRAAANGKTEVIKFLVSRGANTLPGSAMAKLC